MNAAVKTWAIDTASRTMKTFAQAEVGAITAHTAKILPGDLAAFTAAAGIAALVCVFTNIQSFPTGAIDGTRPAASSEPVGTDPVGADLTSGWVGPTTSPADESAGQEGPGVLGQTPVPAPDPASVEDAPATNTTPAPTPGPVPMPSIPAPGTLISAPAPAGEPTIVGEAGPELQPPTA